MSYYIPLPICVYVCAARVVIFTDRVAHTLEHNPRQVGAPSPVKMGGNHNLIWQLALRKKEKGQPFLRAADRKSSQVSST